MKQVVEPSMVAHLWAHQMQDHARNSGSNFYFHDEHIYSYGSHFRCGSVVRNREGQTAYLITDRTYSSTTGRHMAHVRNAIPAHRMVFTTDRLVETRNDKLTEYFYRQAIYYIVDRVERIDELAYKQKRARRCDYISDIEDELCEISRWIEFWGLGARQRSEGGKWLPSAISAMLSHRWTDREAYWLKCSGGSQYNGKLKYQELLQLIVDMGLLEQSSTARSRDVLCELCARWTDDADVATRSIMLKRLMRDAETKRNKAQLQAFEEKVAKWRRGEAYSLSVPDCYRSNAVLRVRDRKVETSLGITVEAAEAERVWKLMRRYHERKAAFRHDVIRDASDHPWTINSCENDIMQAGCHRLHFDDMAYAARELGLAV